MLCRSCEFREECQTIGLPLELTSRVIIMLSVGATKENIKTIYDEYEEMDIDDICEKVATVAEHCPLGTKEIPAVAC